MSSAPNRPSPAVFRRRRLVALALLAIIVIVVVLLIARPWASSAPGTETPTPTPTPTAEASATPTPDPSATPDPEKTPVPTDVALAEGDPCTPAVLRVEARTDRARYGAEETPQLSLAITNTGSVACTSNVGTSQQVFTITSGDEVYWRSTDCQGTPADAEVTLEPGVTVASAAPLSWDRTRSATATCDTERPTVPSGGATYHLQTSVGGVDSERTAQFILE